MIRELQKTFPSKYQRGFCVFLTGLSGAGKSVIAGLLREKLTELAGRTITLLDGDVLRQQFARTPGFSKEDRDLNISRMAYIASEIVKHRGIAICAAIAPYEKTRQQARDLISQHGGFIEGYIATPIEVCEQRDTKGLYAKARSGEITNFTGINDPYEIPKHPEVIVDTSALTPTETIQRFILKLESLGFLKS